jgi:hypothetical protein
MFKRSVAALVGVAMVATPSRLWADDRNTSPCPTFYQVASHATGGDWIAGILTYVDWGSVARSDNTTSTTTTTSTTGSLGVVAVASESMTTSVTVTTTQTGSTTTTQEPIGFYNMNDGSTWQINCISWAARQL